MRTFYQRAQATATPNAVVTLPYDRRQKSRLRVATHAGEPVAIILPRGSSLRHGDCLRDEAGATILIEAAEERVSRVRSDDPHLLTRAAYHLGNRHVPLQIEPGTLYYQVDHVLDAMVHELGLHVEAVTSRFEPESGAYGAHGHSHAIASHPSSHAHGGPDEHGHSHAPASPPSAHGHGQVAAPPADGEEPAEERE